MRMIVHPIDGKGRPPLERSQARSYADDLVMLTQAALSLAGTERTVLHGLTTVPAGVRGKANSYEETVVDRFNQLALRALAVRGMSPVWERVLPVEGDPTQGRPAAIDVSLFDASEGVETRLEFGVFTNAKIRSDADKLVEASPRATPGFEDVRNMLLQWVESTDRLTKNSLTDMAEKMRKGASSRPNVTLLAVSGVDLFSVSDAQHSVAYVGLFEVTAAGVSA